jgi:hypothetical protein
VRRKTAFGSEGELVVAISMLGGGSAGAMAFKVGALAAWSSVANAAEKGQACTGALVVTAVNRTKTIPAAMASSAGRSMKRRYRARAGRFDDISGERALSAMFQILPLAVIW